MNDAQLSITDANADNAGRERTWPKILDHVPALFHGRDLWSLTAAIEILKRKDNAILRIRYCYS